jgi:hypothetical protein
MRLVSHTCLLPGQTQRPIINSLSRHTMHTTQNKFKRPRIAASTDSVSAGSSPSSSPSREEDHQAQQQRAAYTARPKVVIITGPTAVGKTKLGLELAKHIGGEIISADSVQVYRGLDVGSDKVSCCCCCCSCNSHCSCCMPIGEPMIACMSESAHRGEWIAPWGRTRRLGSTESH